MNEEITQDLSPEEAKASLGLSTRLSEQFLMQQMAQEPATMGETGGEGMGQMGDVPMEAPQTPQDAQGEELEPEVEKEAVEGGKDHMKEMESMKTDIELLKKVVLKSDE